MGHPCKEYFAHLSSNIELVLYCIVNSIILLTAITENLVVLYTIVRKPRLHTPAYCLNAALALSDLLIVLLGGCSYVPIIAIGRIKECDIRHIKPAIIVIHGTFTITTSLLLCLITRDRYHCIQSSKTTTPHTSMKKNILLALACFLISLALSSLVLLEFKVSWFSARELYSSLFSMAFVVIAIYYQKLRKLVKDHEKSIRSSNCAIQMNSKDTGPQQGGHGYNHQDTGPQQHHRDTGQETSHQNTGRQEDRQDSGQEANHREAGPQLRDQSTGQEGNHRDTEKQKRNSPRRRSSINSSIIMLVGSFAVAYFPFAIVFTMHTINERVFQKLDPRVSHAFVWANTFGYLNAVIDPMIYAFRCDPIGKELRKFIYGVRRTLFRSPVEPNSETT
eukprot:Seg821.16 transcript_id=Seg821.16/GoldUCD/mRNA.D3Y31 product="Dopamine D2 receptor" protein_id=Seg821.16/GoldUCD/D3Y31